MVSIYVGKPLTSIQTDEISKTQKTFSKFQKRHFFQKFLIFVCFLFFPERPSYPNVLGRKKSKIGAKLDFLEFFENTVFTKNKILDF